METTKPVLSATYLRDHHMQAVYVYKTFKKEKDKKKPAARPMRPLSPRDSFCLAVYGYHTIMFSRAFAKVRNETEAEDVVSFAILKAIESYDRQGFTATSGADSLSKWLCRIVDNAALDVLRKVRKHKTRSVDDFAFCSDKADTIREAQDTFGLKQVELDVIAARVAGYKINEIAVRTGRSKYWVRNTMLLAKSKIKEAHKSLVAA